MLLRYHYLQPADGRYRYDAASEPALGTYARVYSGKIPAGDSEPAEEILERLVLRHAAGPGPAGRDVRPIGTGDILDLAGLGLWQVTPLGFRPLPAERTAAA